jgi:aspartate oxidase
LVGLRNAIEVAQLVAGAALRNPTSVGTHYRGD